MAKPPTFTKIIAIPDCHHPYVDKTAWNLALRTIQKVKPDHIIVMGDFVDCYAVSDYPKDPARKSKLKYEVDAGAKARKQLIGLSDEFTFLEGNHCARLGRYIATHAAALYGLVSMPELLGVDQKAWKPYKETYRLGRVGYCHDVGYCGQNVLHQSLHAYGGNLVTAHTHRAGIVYDGNLRGERHFHMNVGHLSDVSKVDYAHQVRIKSWQLGLGYIEMEQSGKAYAQFCPFVGRKCVVGGMTVI